MSRFPSLPARGRGKENGHTPSPFGSGRLREVLSRGIALAGMDLMEFNPRRIPPGEPLERISAYRIASNLIKMLCFDVRI
jgi:hypothetical protein